MLIGFLIIAVVAFLAVMSHRRTRLEERIYKNVPLVDWLIGMVFPVILYMAWVILVRNIVYRPSIDVLPVSDFDLLAISTLFLVFTFMGNTIHFISKVMWRYLKKKETSLSFRVNEMFHGKLSHYLIFVNSILLVFFLPLLEINHPLVGISTEENFYLIVLTGIVFGFMTSKGVFYTNQWFGGYTKPLFIILAGCLLSLSWIIQELNLRVFQVYPVTLFIYSTYLSAVAAFVFRMIFIFARLNNRRRLRFVTRMLSI